MGGDFAWATSLFLTGLAAKLGLIFKFGQPFPYLDQWPDEAIGLFFQWLSGNFSAAKLFVAHNEHRLVFNRLWELLLLRLNGQWDCVWEMACNAVVHCAGAAGLGWVMARLLGKRSWPLVWLVLVLDLALPFAWENTLWGFQSQVYFLLILSWLTIWLMGLNRAWSPRWWLGALTGLTAVFTMASGFLAAATVAALAGLATLKQQQEWRRQLPTWVVCAGVMALGLALKMSIPPDLATQARTAGEFLQALGKNLAWPWAILPWYAPFNLVPLLWLGWKSLRDPEPPKPAVLLIFGLGLWAGLQALAGAYARGIGGGAPAWRSMDSLAFIAIANGLAAYILLTDYRPKFRFKPLLPVVLAVWAVGCLGGLAFLTERVMTEFMPQLYASRADQLKAARAFMATGDRRVFETRPDDNRPVPNVEADVWLLQNPVLRKIYPACVREPLHLVPVTNNSSAFIPRGWLLSEADDPAEISWGSWSAQKAAARGTFESLPVKLGSLPYLEIPVAGDLGKPGLTLQLIELKSGRVTDIFPPRSPGGEWLNVQIPSPAGEFKVVARDDSDTGWFAFKEPREIGRLSVWTLYLLSAWKYILVLGLGAFALNLVRWRNNHPDAPDLSPRPPG